MSVTYYLLVDGVDGGSTAEGHAGWFEISGYDFALLQHIASGGSGSGAGVAELFPLTVDLALGSGLTELLSIAASGEHLTGIRLEGVAAVEGSPTVFALTLGDVVITQVLEGDGSADRVTFDYRRVWIETTSNDGGPLQTESFGYDRDSNSVIDTNSELGQPVAGQYGDFTLNSDGSYSYVPDDLASAPVGAHATDQFTYTVADDYGGSDTATIDIVLNRSPAAAADYAAVQVGKSLVVQGNDGVLSNDSDLDADGLSVTAVSGGDVGSAVAGQHGSLMMSADGGYTYTTTGSLGSASIAFDAFSYEVSDGYGGTVTGSLLVTLYAGQQNYILGTSGDDELFVPPVGNGKAPWGNGKSILSGGEGDDTILGGNGSDVLIAGSGDNVMTGGRGPDTFVFDAGATGQNVLTDFKLGVDQLTFVDTTVIDTVAFEGSTVLELNNGGEVILTGVAAIESWEMLV